MGDDYVYREIDAPFNMALATLKRLDTILQQIRLLNYTFPDPIQRQREHIYLIKQFYLNSIPLLKDTDIDNNEEKEILNYTMKTSANVKSGTQRRKELYDAELEITLNNTLIKLQKKLKRFFMPTGKDPGRAIEF